MSDLENSSLSECASRIGYEFQNPALLRQALIHRSWQAENSDPLTNERFEFLGDAVLGWVIADVAFHRLADMPEGKLTDLRRSVVNMHALADIARQLGIGEFLLLGKGEDAAGGRDKSSILADALEALIGAVFLDAGFEPARTLVGRLFKDVDITPGMAAIGKDPKTELQEWLQGRKMNLPIYRVVATSGAAHQQIFDVECEVSEIGHVERGIGASRRAGEQASAAAMLQHLLSN